MPSQTFDTLYALVAESEPYLRAEIVLTTNAIPTGQQLAYIDLTQPIVAGYAPMRADRLEQLFPDPEIVAGKAVRLVSRQMDLRNADVANVQITGVVLVVWKDIGTPVVVAVVPTAQIWRSGTRIAVRLRVTSNIYTEP